MLTTLISDESQAQTDLKKELKQLNDRHKAQLSASKEEINKHKQANKILMDLLKSSVGSFCRLAVLLQDVEPSIEPVTQDQQRRIEMRCKQIMVDAEAIVKGQSTLLPSELFNHAISAGDSTLAQKEAATGAPICSQNSPTDNQSSSTDDTFRIDSERLPLQEGHSESSFVLAADPHDPAMNNLADLYPKEFPEDRNSGALKKNMTKLESQSALQRLPISAATASSSNKITLQRKKHSITRPPPEKARRGLIYSP
ncbi:hypothetical protein ACIF8Z_21240 [Pseudomonas promysalinigenes]|uniref:hypothetical protein n=1 Tax=Pseudomonas promysalinigenes TaxID=485898 RepID=UPI0037CB175E